MTIEQNLPIVSYVSFQSVDPEHPLIVSAQLRVPDAVMGKAPAVVIAHGSAGVDSRGSFYAEALNRAGIATLEIDMWAPRGWLGGVTGRPRGVPETLPDAFGALKFLSGQSFMDAQRIGILGFSWGGAMAMLCATQAYTSRFTDGTLKFAAHVAHYPVCWVYNHVPGYEFDSLTGSPVLIQTGALDAYDAPDSGRRLVESLPAAAQHFVSLKIYEHASHGWDRLQPAMTVHDPFSHMGRGGEVPFVPDPQLACASRTAALRFFQQAFGMDTWTG